MILLLVSVSMLTFFSKFYHLFLLYMHYLFYINEVRSIVLLSARLSTCWGFKILSKFTFNARFYPQNLRSLHVPLWVMNRLNAGAGTTWWDPGSPHSRRGGWSTPTRWPRRPWTAACPKRARGKLSKLRKSCEIWVLVMIAAGSGLPSTNELTKLPRSSLMSTMSIAGPSHLWLDPILRWHNTLRSSFPIHHLVNKGWLPSCHEECCDCQDT